MDSAPILPVDIEAEKAVLGAILLNPVCYYQSADRIRVDDLSLDSHRRIYGAMLALDADSKPVGDPVCLAEQLQSTKELERVGGVPYLASLSDGLPRYENIGYYLRIVAEKAKLRRLICECGATMRAAAEPGATVADCAGRLEDAVLTLRGNERDERESPEAQLARLESLWDTATGEVLGMPLGVPPIDKATGGILDNELWFIVGRPGWGKTFLALQCALKNSHEGRRVRFFSLEMTETHIRKRMAGIMGRIPMMKLRDGRVMDAEERERFRQAWRRVASLPLDVDTSSQLTLEELTARTTLAVKRVFPDCRGLRATTHCQGQGRG